MSTVASISFLRLFAYSDRVDFLFMVTGLLSAIGMGIIQPLLFYFVGNIYKNMDPYTTSQDYYDKAVEMTYQLLIWGSVYSVFSYIAVVAWIYVGSRQAHHFRRAYLQAILRQDVAWFDARQVSELPNAIANDAIRIEKATGDKLVALIFITVMVITSLVISFKEATQLTLLALAFSPLMAGGMAVTSRTMEKNAKEEDKAYTGAGGVAEEVLTEIKTVAAFNSQDYFSRKYVNSLTSSYRQMLKDGITIGISTGLSIGSFLGMLAATVVAGATMIRNQDQNWTDDSTLNTGKIIIVVFVCMMAFHNMATLIPCIKLMIEGRVAAANVFAVINTCPEIVSGNEDRVLMGKVEFLDVEFSYPRQKNRVLNKIAFSLNPGDCLAIVGETGCGKSTIVSLLMRFYDPSSGQILIDGIDLKSYNLSSFRNQCGLVSQEPVLFNDTIRNNLLYAKPDATEDELCAAVRSAEALDFITEFDLGFDTQVGQKGSQLSGGEKQRVAIARAVLRKPKILLLDEATSALDKNTECAVQETLNQLMSGCTTVLIAHRISTVRKANKVIVLAQGKVCESGSQTELMALQGRFYHMVKMQEIDVGDGRNGESQNSMKRCKTTAEATVVVQQNAHFTRRFLKMTGKYWFLMVLGSIGAILVGAGYPCNGLMFGFEIQVLTRETGAELEADSRYYGGFFGVCAVAVFCGLLLQAISFPLLSAKSTRELRQDSFRSLLAFDLEFFDKNNPSALASRLSSDCQKINGLGGSIFGLLAGMVCSLVTGYTISGIFSWQIALIILLTLPVQIFSMIATFLAQIQGLVAYSYEDATAFASDCILNFRTVKAFSAEAGLLEKYMEVTGRATKLIQKRAHVGGLSFGLGYGLLFYIYGLIFWLGAYLFLHGYTSFKDMNIAIFAAIMGTSSVFLSGIFAPDVKQGQVAAKNLFRLLDYKPKIDVNSEEGEKGPVQGELEFVNVTFAYPTRDVQVLTDVSFRVPKGSTFAVVGTTGSGKSTIFQLLLRFYDPLHGVIRLDGRDLREFNLQTLRSAISIVSQEPVLFSGSIKDNISLGSAVTDQEIMAAIAQAQASTFVEASADTYQRDVGAKGSHLSGGEKQRLAIARAIVRNPKIVILDEATAALDSDTEQALMSSLKRVLQGRTCMAIAHRVKTVSDFDQIAVLSQGRLIELGTFNQLNAKRGYFYSLVQQM